MPTPSFQDLSDKRFGKKSKLFHVLTKELGLPYHTYSCFLATFISTCGRKQQASQLLNDKDFNTERLLPLVEYNKIIRQMEVVGGEPLWSKLEKAYNEEAKDTFLQHRGASDITLPLDDDKQKFNYAKHANTWGLWRQRHIQTN